MTLLEELSRLALTASEEYEQRLSLALRAREASSELLNALDDALLDASTSAPEAVEMACRLNLKLFGDDYIVARGWTFNTLSVSLAVQGKGAEFIECLRAGLQFAIENGIALIGMALCNNSPNAFNPEVLGRDNCIEVFKIRHQFYLACEEWNLAIKELISAAFYFSSFGAFPSAYRALHNAQDIAEEHSLFVGQAQILEAHAIVAREGGDLAYARDHIENAIALLNTIGQPVAAHLRVNLSTIKMNLGAFEEALREFTDVLSDANASSGLTAALHHTILISVAVCQRELRDLAGAEATIKSVLSDLSEHEVENRIEANLVAARTFCQNDSARMQTHLNEAIKYLEQSFGNCVGRPHYRSGVRGQFLSRIKRILFELPDQGSASGIIDVLAFMRQSVLVEWASLLDWRDSIGNCSAIDEELRQQLRTSFEKVVERGAPILFSYHEKYDDPFAGSEDHSFSSLARYWNDFNSCLKNIERQCGVSPYAGATVAAIANRFTQTLANEVLLFIVFALKSWRLISISGDRYWSTDIPAQLVDAFKRELYKDKRGILVRSEISNTVIALQSVIENRLEGVLATIAKSSTRGIVILSDHLSVDLPLVGAIVANPAVRARLLDGSFTIRCSPIAYERKSEGIIHSYFGMWDSSSELLSSHEELVASARLLGTSRSTIVDLATAPLDSFRAELAQAEMIQIATHGEALSKFTDPHFAELSGTGKAFHFEEIQRNFWKYNYQMAVVNACHASDPTVQRMGEPMKTDDIIGYPSMLLLNRRSRVISPLWGTLDVVGFLMSYFLSERLSQGHSSSTAYSMAIARMYEITREDLLSTLSKIESPTLREQKLRQFGRSREPYPLRHPFCYGAYALHTMLID